MILIVAIELMLLVGWVTVCWRVNYLGLWPATQANSAFYPQRDGKWAPPKCGDALRLGSKGRCGSFHLWMGVWMAGKTVWSLINTCLPYLSALEVNRSWWSAIQIEVYMPLYSLSLVVVDVLFVNRWNDDDEMSCWCSMSMWCDRIHGTSVWHVQRSVSMSR